MISYSFVLAAASLLGFPTTFAVPEFVNHGDTAFWSSKPYVENKGAVNSVDNVALSLPGKSLKFEQTYDPNWKSRFHTEANYSTGYHRDQTKYYGFAFRLHSEWEFTTQSYNLAQFIADFTDTKCDDHSPTTMVWLNGTRLITRVKHGQLLPGKPCPPNDRKWDCNFQPNTNCQPTTTFELANNIQAGRWYRLTFRAKWKSDETGEFQWWLDGVSVLNKTNIKTTLLDDGREFEFRVGLYANSWYDEKRLVGSQSRRQLWIDEIGVGSEFKDADPAALDAQD